MYLLTSGRGGSCVVCAHGLTRIFAYLWLFTRNLSRNCSSFFSFWQGFYELCNIFCSQNNMQKSSSGNLLNNLNALVSKRYSFCNSSNALNLFSFFCPTPPSYFKVPSFLHSSSLALKYIEAFSLLLSSIRFRGDRNIWK